MAARPRPLRRRPEPRSGAATRPPPPPPAGTAPAPADRHTPRPASSLAPLAGSAKGATPGTPPPFRHGRAAPPFDIQAPGGAPRRPPTGWILTIRIRRRPKAQFGGVPRRSPASRTARAGRGRPSRPEFDAPAASGFALPATSRGTGHTPLPGWRRN